MASAAELCYRKRHRPFLVGALYAAPGGMSAVPFDQDPAMSLLTRREFTGDVLGSLLAYSLLETLSAQPSLAAESSPEIRRWLSELNALCRDVRDQTLRQVEWQAQVEELFRKVSLPELLALIDFDKLVGGAKLVDRGARSIRFSFPKVEGLPSEYVFGKQIFALKKGRSVVPHGHNNMATAFLVLRGNFEGRHYDRLQDEPEHLLIRPTIDRRFGAGEFSTVSDYRDNIHWFRALDEPAYIFNIHVLKIRPGSRLPTGRVYLDPNGEKLAGGVIRAPKIGYREAHQRYG